MPRVRLTGLFLLITAIVIGLASAATRTSHLKFKRPDSAVAAEEGVLVTTSVQFVTVPIVYPLIGVGMLGLLLWFMPAGLDARAESSRKGRRKRRSGSRGNRSPGILSFGIGRSKRRR